MSYKHLSLEERYYIAVERRKGTSQKKMAASLSRSPSTLSRELSRNMSQRGYRHAYANNKAITRHIDKPKAIKLTDDIKTVISEHIEQDWSPEQIAGRLRKDDVISVHHETIYQYVLADKKAGGTLYTHLRHQNKTYRKRYGSAHTRNGITNRVDIDERPETANNRERIGDWEGDTMIGKGQKGVLVTLDDRRSKLRLAAPLKSKHAKGVTETIIKLLEPIKAGYTRSLSTTVKNLHSMKPSPKRSIVMLILQSHITLGNGVKMRMQTGFYGSTFPKQ